ARENHAKKCKTTVARFVELLQRADREEKHRRTAAAEAAPSPKGRTRGKTKAAVAAENASAAVDASGAKEGPPPKKRKTKNSGRVAPAAAVEERAEEAAAAAAEETVAEEEEEATTEAVATTTNTDDPKTRTVAAADRAPSVVPPGPGPEPRTTRDRSKRTDTVNSAPALVSSTAAGKRKAAPGAAAETQPSTNTTASPSTEAKAPPGKKRKLGKNAPTSATAPAASASASAPTAPHEPPQDYPRLKVVELTALLKERGLPHTGKKAALIARLQESDAAAAMPPSTTLPAAAAAAASAPPRESPPLSALDEQLLGLLEEAGDGTQGEVEEEGEGEGEAKLGKRKRNPTPKAAADAEGSGPGKKRRKENKDMGFVWAPHGISQALLASFAGWTKTQQRRHMSRHDFGCKGKSLYGAVADGPYGCNIDSYNLCGVSARRTGRDGVMKHGQQRMLTTSVCHKDRSMILVLLLGLFAGYAVSEPQCWTEYHAPQDWFGSPNYHDCQRLLFGNNDLSGIAAIDALSHAFVVPNTQREFESDSQWANRVIALTPTGSLSMESTIRNIYRETGQWLTIAQTGQNINDVCVHGGGVERAHTGGFDRTGANGRLIILLYQPGSRIDREIRDDLDSNQIVTIATADLYDASDYDSADEDLRHLSDEFAVLLNVNDEINLPHPRQSWEDSFGYSRVGKSDPRVKNLGSSWVMNYNSVISLLPVHRAVPSLAAFYTHIVDIAADKVGNGTDPVKDLDFVSKRLSLTLSSPAPIPWDWIISFARGMSLLLDSRWAVLFNATARNAYWDVATINAALRIAVG
ncbi:MAG: hypothetical protein LQ348_006778, partial [Seirophora lacunosa]